MSNLTATELYRAVALFQFLEAASSKNAEWSSDGTTVKQIVDNVFAVSDAMARRQYNREAELLKKLTPQPKHHNPWRSSDE